jgi:ATP-dependent Zn protease
MPSRRPCIDDIGVVAVVKERTGANNQLAVTEMDDFHGNNGIMALAAMNMRDVLDSDGTRHYRSRCSLLLMPQRFDQ